MAPLNLIPQKREFFVLYNRAAANIVEISERLIELLERYPDGVDDLVRDIRELEHEGDRLTHEIVDLVNRNFVTPFDRDDMYRLAGALDDICDYIDEAAGKVVSYHVGAIREPAVGQAQVIRRAAGKLADAISRLEGFKDSARSIAELRDLEDEGDRLVHEAVSSLFADGADPLVVIRWKDIHEALEDAVDACDKAANVLEAILVKNR
jgi:predicted phosphate transport protein (TIGR00153 family)